MARKRLTEMFPFLLPLRRWQKKQCCYLKMKFDKNVYPLQVCRRTGFTAQPCFAGECRSQQQTGRRNRISGWESRINEKRSSPFGLLLYIGMFSCVMNIQTAVELSKSLGSRTVMSGSISRGKNDPSQSLQMMERPLMTPDELKSMPKGSFIVAKTGVHPMKVKLRLFLDWGIRFGKPYEVPEKAQRFVAYADKQELEESIIRRHYGTIVMDSEQPQGGGTSAGGMAQGIQAAPDFRKTVFRP